jgi:PAS domain S-box-containing protein
VIASLPRGIRYGAGFVAAIVFLIFLPTQLAVKLFILHYRNYFEHLPSLQQGADILIGISCSAIAVTLALLFHKAQPGIASKWIVGIFGLVVVICGGIYLLNVPSVGSVPLRFADAIRLITAVASLVAAIYLPSLVGRAHAMLGRANQAEQRQIEVDAATRELKERDNLLVRREESREQQYRFLADFMPQIVWTAKPDGSFDYYNQRWYELTGDVREEVEYARDGDQTWGFVLHKDDLKRCMDRWYKAVSTGEPYEIEYRLLDNRTGNYRWFLGRARAMRDECGQIVKWFGTCADIDDQKKVERDLREIRDKLEERVEQRTAELTNVNESLTQQIAERQRIEEALLRQTAVLRSVLENMGDAVLVADDPQHIVLYNRAASLMFGPQAIGVAEEEKSALYGLHLMDRVTLLPAQELPVARACRGESFDNVEIYVRRGGATEGLWCCATGRPLVDNKGKVTGGVIVCRDFTDRKLAEVQLAKAAAELTLSNDELRRHSVELQDAKVRAEAATLAKSEFLATMSHEIRTPMNGVIGMSRLLLDASLTPEQRDYAETIHESSSALLTIINDILDLSRIEAGKLDLEIGDMNVAETVERVRDLLATAAELQGTTVSVLVASDVPTAVRADQGRVRQTLVNLAGNAVKFSPDKGKVEISVSVETGAVTSWLRFAVKDTGIGIAPDVQQRLFRPFIQGDSSIPGRFGGSGLGLSISRRLAERMGGEIGVQSSLGLGSTFWFRIPLIPSVGGGETPLAVPPERKPFAGNPSERRILVVDDNRVNQKVAGAMLRRHGYRFDSAGNGQEALIALSKQAYDVVLMDCQMPVMDGFAATAEIRRRESAGRHIPIIALTAGAMADERERCLLAGMDDFLAKPIDPEQLDFALGRAISGILQQQLSEEKEDMAVAI